MAEVIREFIRVEPSGEASRALSECLSKQYAPLLESGRIFACRLLRSAPEILPFPEGGELFAEKNSAFHYFLTCRDGFEVGSIGKSGVRAGHEAFMQSVLSRLPAERRALEPSNRSLSAVMQESGSFSASEQDRRAARLLADETARRYLREISGAGRKERGEKEKVPSRETLDELRKLELIKEEFQIFCRQSGQQVVMVNSLAAIEEASKQGFKCFACGRGFPEEKLTHFVSRTPYGRKMSADNKWLLLNAVDVLEARTASKTLCVQTEAEVVDLFFNLKENLILVEVKEFPYSLKDAYLLSRKINFYKARACFILSAAPLPPAVRDYLDSFPDLPAAHGNSPESLAEWLPKQAEAAALAEADEILRKLSGLSALPLGELSESFFFSGELPPRAEIPEETVPETPAPSVSEITAVPAPEPEPPAEEEPAADSAVAKTAILEKLLAELSGDITGRESNLHVLLRDLGDLPRRWKACLQTENGLIIASTLDQETSELLASFAGDCWDAAEKAAARRHKNSLKTVTLASRNFSVEIYRLPGFYLSLAAVLETVVPAISEPLDASGTLRRISQQWLDLAAVLLDRQGKVLPGTGGNPQKASAFAFLAEVFPQEALQFEVFGRGELKGIAARFPSEALAAVNAGETYLGVSCPAEQVLEDLFPVLLAYAEPLTAPRS